MNEFVDMHVHSKFSIDGMSTMEDYCLIAGKTGTRVSCVNKHVDFNSDANCNIKLSISSVRISLEAARCGLGEEGAVGDRRGQAGRAGQAA